MYAELQITSNFSFLRGASHPEELAIMAKAQGLAAFAITDRNTLAGVVKAHTAAKEHDIPFIPGCRLDLTCGTSLLAYPRDRAAYGHLTELLTTGNRRAPKGDCYLSMGDVAAHAKGCTFALLPNTLAGDPLYRLPRLREQLAEDLYLAASYTYSGRDTEQLARLAFIGDQTNIPLLATGDVFYHQTNRRILADVLTCIREHCRIDNAGYRLQANAERFLKPPHEMMRLFTQHPDAIKNSLKIKEACTFSLDELKYNYPQEPVPEGETSDSYLSRLAHAGLRDRFPKGIPDHVKATLAKELKIVAQKKYAPYFLTVHDIVSFAKREKILCQGRGSAANSIICYALGITDVDPTQVDLLFERFVSDARDEPPDIDVDFEHERREEVIQYIYRRYGRHRAGLAATLITYRTRSAVREVGKVMGLSEDTISALSGTVWGSYGREINEDQAQEKGLNLSERKVRETIDIASELSRFPRHLSQHVGGFVLTETPLHEIVPIQNAAMQDRTVIEWNKDDLDALAILKVDILSLGMLTCIRKAFDLIKLHQGLSYSLASVPQEDSATYNMMQRADTVGVFQVESRAQMSMLPRLKPKTFYDLVVQVAIVRPGPIQGDMVHPYLRRRQGKEAPEMPYRDPAFGTADELVHVLSKTYGVPLFQEQAMKIAMVAAGFSAMEADRLRRAMASFRNTGTIHRFEEKFIQGMTGRGYQLDYAQRCFNQIKGFADYGFPESHAAAFAMLAYVSAWLKRHYPETFACALLNSQPMGFYAPAQIIRDAREHGVEVRPIDINYSDWDNKLEPCEANKWRFALRLGMRQVKGLKKEAVEEIVAKRIKPYTDVADLHTRALVSVNQLERLAEADAFRSCHIDRRQALWLVRGLTDIASLPLFAHEKDTAAYNQETVTHLPSMPLSEHVVNDYQSLRFSIKAHPLSFLREQFDQEGIIACSQIPKSPPGTLIKVAGLVLVRQRPGSAKGVIFMTIEDETATANLVIWKKVFERDRAVVMGCRLIIVEGEIQREDGVTHVIAKHLHDASEVLYQLSDQTMEPAIAPADEGAMARQRGYKDRFRSSSHPRSLKNILPKSRDFH